jgi:ElaB/YqjD/DUF883 family membrane-anchored ribosome-binding protein
MSEPIEGSGAAAVGAHSKDAMEGSQDRALPDQGRSGSASSGRGVSSASGKAEDIGGSVRSAADAVRSAADQASEGASRLATTAQEGVSRAGRQAYRQGAQAGAYVGDVVRSEPLIMLAAVGALGFALGLLVGRRQ